MPAANHQSAASSSAQDVRDTREAALRGALQAFARQPNLPPKHATKSSGSTLTSHRTRPPTRPSKSSQSISLTRNSQHHSRQPSDSSPASTARSQHPADLAEQARTIDTSSNISVDDLDSSTLTSRPSALKLVIPTPGPTGDGVVKTQAIPPEIHSPKPIRLSAAAATLESTSAAHKLGGAERPTLLDHAGTNISKETDRDPDLGSIPQEAGLMNEQGAPSTTDGSQATSRATSISSSVAFESDLPPVHLKGPPSRARQVTAPVPSMTYFDQSERIRTLANAIVASSLASSRASSPAKSPGPKAPPYLRRQTENTLHHLAHSKQQNLDSRSPSPAKKMRQTLRKASLETGEDEQPSRRPRGHFHIRQHPNKHHEGDRKRWRDEITVNERKRYEGVWAANRDLHMRYTDEEREDAEAMSYVKGSVSALVVKDVWMRSRLSEHTLEEIWDLVDREEAGRLGREEFVVGLWLVDQTLKGRKVPPKVQSSVWQSVRGIYGLKVPKKKK